MSRIRASIFPFAFILLALCVLNPVFAQSKAATVNVSDLRQFLVAIGSNKTIVLKKGDYRLSAAYDLKTDYVSWNESDQGKELAISKVENMTVRGAEGVRIICDTPSAYIMGLYGGKNISFDNIRFVRSLKEGTPIAAGGVYAESIGNLTFDRCSIEGKSNVPFELWECESVALKRSKLSGGVSGIMSAVYSRGISVSDCGFSDNEGYPLLYFEESDEVSFKKTRFENCSGGNFIEVYAESGKVERVGFEGCVFSGNSVDYFSGTGILPATEGCEYDGNSFDESWAENSVAPAKDEYYYEEKGEEKPAYFEHYASGLAFYYPNTWELQEADDENRVGLYSPDGGTVMAMTKAWQIPAAVDPGREAKKVFADALVALVKVMKDEAGIALKLGATGEILDSHGVKAQEYRGEAGRNEGEKAFVRARLYINKGAVHAMLAIAKEAVSLDPETEAALILESVELASKD